MHHLRRAAAGALALTTVIALGACTKQDNGNNTLADRKADPTQEGGPHTTAPAREGALEIEAKDNEFDPKTLSVPAGDVTLTMKNTGQSPHTFTSTELNVDVNADAGKTVEVKLTGLKAGSTVKFVCKYHESLKMVGELTVA